MNDKIIEITTEHRDKIKNIKQGDEVEELTV